MGIISIASGSSCWNGLDYYKSKKIRIIKEISDVEYISIVSGAKEYNVYLNLKNSYVFKVNGKFVGMSFDENGPTADECLTRVLENLYI